VSRFKRLRLSLQLLRTSSLTHHIAPIDRDRLARDVARSIAAQEKSRVSNLFGTAFMLHGDKVFEHGLERLTLTLGLILSLIGVRIRPGQTSLTRMPRVAYSSAALFVKPMTPCFAA
jgi:hypothetical protein